jgi:hypothetical protein
VRLRVGFVFLAFSLAGGLGSTSGRVPAGDDAHRQIASLNHFWAALDDETARAIVTSDYLKRFAHIVVNTVTAAGNRQWTGRYVRGRQTYAELFSVTDLASSGAPTRIGASGIGISGDTPGVLDALEQRLRAAGIATTVRMERRRFNTREVDWYTQLGLVSARAEHDINSSVWAMEYVASFFDDPEAGKETAEGPGDVISRERYLDDGYADHLMRDVTGLELAVSNDDVPAIETMLRAAGFQVSRSAATLTAHGSDFDCLIDVVPVAAIGLRRVEFVLNRVVPWRHVEVIGHSTLTVGPGRRAAWTFAQSGTRR